MTRCSFLFQRSLKLLESKGVPVTLLTANYVRVSAFVDGSKILGFGKVIGPASENGGESGGSDVFLVKFDSVNVGPHVPLEVTTSVWVQSDDRASTGIITKVRNDGTYSVLMDSGVFEDVVARDRIVASEGKNPLLSTDRCKNLAEWAFEAGVERKTDAELAALVLCKNGWRREKMYLLKDEDVAVLQHLHRSTRASILELAEWEMESRRVWREKEREREKERLSWSYFTVKYAGVVSATFASFGVCSVFLWNYLNWRKGRRDYQMELAIARLTSPNVMCAGDDTRMEYYLETSTDNVHGRDASETKQDKSSDHTREADILRRIVHFPSKDGDVLIPRGVSVMGSPQSVAVIGTRGCGKSTVVRRALRDLPGVVHVAVRIGWSHEDLTKALVRALGVDNLAACGDLTTFTQETLSKVSQKNGIMPIIVYSLRMGDDFLENKRLVNVVLNQQRHISRDLKMASTISEIDHTRVHVYPEMYDDMILRWIQDLTPGDANLLLRPRMNPDDIDILERYLGTNPGTLHQATMDISCSEEGTEKYVERKSIEAQMYLSAFRRRHSELDSLLDRLTDSEYEDGIPLRDYPDLVDGKEVPNVVFHVNWMQRAIFFNSKLMYCAARLLQSSTEQPISGVEAVDSTTDV